MEPDIDKQISVSQPTKKIKLEEAGQIQSLNSDQDTSKRKIQEKPLLSKSSQQLRAILHDKYYKQVETVNTYTCTINNRNEASRLLREINEVYHLKELKHLKRIRSIDGQLKIIITAIKETNTVNNTATLDELFNETSVNTKGLSEPVVTAVPKQQPLTRHQYNECLRIWPTSFHENKHISKLINGTLFGEEELEEKKSYMKQAIDVAVVGKSKGMLAVGAVMVNPKTKTILCKAHDLSARHPLQHTTMVCIDMIAKLQGGGAWDLEDYFTYKEPSTTHGDNQDDCVVAEGCSLSKDNKDSTRTKVETSGHGNRPCSSLSSHDPDKKRSEIDDGYQDNNVPYLCTGYDLYITREPCVMCSMALLHSRIHRVFYAQSFPSVGGLGSRYKTHCLEDTNHHFEVFAGLLENECKRVLAEQTT